MKRMSVLLVVTALAGCTIVVLPHATTPQGQTSIEYLSIHQAAAPAPKPDSPTSDACARLSRPATRTMPEIPPLAAKDRANRKMVEGLLVDYVLVLREYIADLFGSYQTFYNAYQTQCRPAK